MSKQHDKHYIYRAFLHLYPKQHREAYGQQMVQTLDDILADQDTALGRFAVWLKVSIELPINALEENISSIGELSVNKLTKLTSKQYVYGVFAILLVGSYSLIALAYLHQKSQIRSLNQSLTITNQNQEAMSGGNYIAATIIPNENAVYLPLARLKLPATVMNEGLVYTYSPAHTLPGLKKLFNAELDISTHDLSISNYPTAQFDCTQVVYADFVTPSYPVNPMWKSDGSVKLTDGRTMNVYYASSIPGCQNTWATNSINSKAIAASLKEAVSY